MYNIISYRVVSFFVYIFFDFLHSFYLINVAIYNLDSSHAYSRCFVFIVTMVWEVKVKQPSVYIFICVICIYTYCVLFII